MSPKNRNQKVQTTIRLPRPLYQRAKSFVKENDALSTINDFFVSAVSFYLKTLERRRIDAAFLGMAEDAAYQKQAKRIADEFELADWEALQQADELGRES